MSFNVYSHSKLESLASLLAFQQKQKPLINFFEAEVICVTNPIVQRWLSVQLAQQNGIEANNDYPLAANLIWKLLRKAGLDCPKKDPLALESLTWKIIPLIDELQDEPEFSTIKNYLSDDLDGTKQWQLAKKIADVFDRYQYHRPEVLLGEQGQLGGWLDILWQNIIADVPNHKLKLIFQFMKMVQAGQIDKRLLPKRVQVFAPSSMPKVVFQFFEYLSQLIEVNFYIVSPTNQYWGDLSSPKKLAKARLQDEQDSLYLDVGNSLLSSWGKVGQVFHDQLILSDQVEFNAEQTQPEKPNSLLKTIQNDIFTLTDIDIEPLFEAQNDGSIQIHQCHSKMRECQVLYDQLLDTISEDKTLKPEDILVLSPNMADYAIYIETVFSPTKDKPYLPWNINDIPLSEDAPIYDVFLALFDLPESRFTQSDVLQFLALKAVQTKFELDAEEVELIKKWISQSNIHWAKNQQHKAQLGLPAIQNNTWQFGLDRMMASYAMGNNQSFEDMVSISQIDGVTGQTLGKLNVFYSKLCQYAKIISGEKTPEQWQLLINEILVQFFAEETDNQHSQTIRDSVDSWLNLLTDLDYKKPLKAPLVKKVLQEKLQSSAKKIAFMSGGITFSSMKPLRNIPFKIIYILGLNEADFPRKETRPEFDTLAKNAHIGDPSLAAEDRYLFLETLMSAREKIIFSYIAHNQKDNSEKQPAILLAELMEYSEQRFGEKLSQQLISKHSLQAYADKNYQHEQPISYDRFWLKMINQNTVTKKQNWQEQTAIEDEISAINLDDLLYFYKNPSASFIRKHLKINLREEQDLVEDDEPIDLDNLEKYQIKKQLAEALLEDGKESDIKKLLLDSGDLPIAKIANKTFTALLDKSEFMRATIQGFDTIEPLIKAFECTIKANALNGQINEINSDKGLLSIRPGTATGPDYLMLWIKFLILKILGEGTNAYIVSDEKFEYFDTQNITKEQAEEYLEILINTYQLGLRKPIALFKHSSFDVAQKLYKNKKLVDIDVAYKWRTGFNTKGDIDDPAVSLLMRCIEPSPVESEEFIELIEIIYLPLLHNLAEIK